MLVKVARLGIKLKFHEIEKEKTAGLIRHEDELKKLQIMKELAATQAEIEAVAKAEEHCSIDWSVENISKLPDDGNSQERVKKFVHPQHTLDGDSGSPPVDTKIERTVINKDESVNTKPNVTFGSYLDTHYLLPSVPSRKDLNPSAPPFAIESTSLQPPAPTSVKFHPETSGDSPVFSTSENDPSPCVHTTEDSLTRLTDLLSQ